MVRKVGSGREEGSDGRRGEGAGGGAGGGGDRAAEVGAGDLPDVVVALYDQLLLGLVGGRRGAYRQKCVTGGGGGGGLDEGKQPFGRRDRKLSHGAGDRAGGAVDRRQGLGEGAADMEGVFLRGRRALGVIAEHLEADLHGLRRGE